MHEPAQAAAFRFGLLKKRLTHPPLRPGDEIIERDDRRPALALAVHEQRPRLWQHASRHHFRQGQAPGVEEDRAGDRIEDEQETRARRLHEQRPFYHPHAVGRQSTELGLLPDDLTAFDVDGSQRAIGRHEEWPGRCDLLPTDVAAESRGPYRSGSGRSGCLRDWCLNDKGGQQEDGQQRHGNPS